MKIQRLAIVLSAMNLALLTLIAADIAGAAEWQLQTTAEYARVRTQFERPIGSFQAIKHKLADMYVKNELARSNAYYGAWAIEDGRKGLSQAICRLSDLKKDWVGLPQVTTSL